MTATDTNTDDDEKRTVSEQPTAAEVLHDLADHVAADLHAFADDVETGDADTDDYWYLLRGYSETFTAMEDAAETGAGLDAYEPHAHAVSEAMKAVHHLTYPDSGAAGVAALRTALVDVSPVRDYRTLTVDPERVQAYTGRDRRDELEERTLSLHDTDGGVTLATEGVDRGADETAGALVELDADQARQLADALYQAADEMEGGE
jgi:hypothetical protein